MRPYAEDDLLSRAYKMATPDQRSMVDSWFLACEVLSDMQEYFGVDTSAHRQEIVEDIYNNFPSLKKVKSL